ncbi:MAG TPA: hypothetical protein PLO51_05640, partial [Candidatus Micrarchaeota archaeon]|nr:hypothetical protein [Candidatus Micrarchaeota archaeon]
MAKIQARLCIPGISISKRQLAPAHSGGQLATARIKGQIFSADFAIAAALFSIALALFMSAGQSFTAANAASAGSLGLSQASILAANLCSPSGQFEGRFSANKTEAFFNSISNDYEKYRAALGLLPGGANYDFSVKMLGPNGQLFDSGRQAPQSAQVAVFRRTGVYGPDAAILEVEVWER